jgi:hypothetical protein
MELLTDFSIPEPSQQVPLQQQLIERSSSRPIDPLLQQGFHNIEQRGQARYNASRLAGREQQLQALITYPTNQIRNRNSRGNSVRRSGRGQGSSNRRSGATSSLGAPPLHMPTVEETALNNQTTVNTWNNSHRPAGTVAAYDGAETHGRSRQRRRENH